MPDTQLNRIRDRLEGDAALRDVVTLLFNLYELMCPALMDHSRELARHCERLARALDWPAEKARMAYLAGLMHDVGHLLVPGQIRNFRGQKPPARDRMDRDHPDLGARLLRKVRCLEPILPAITHHHENFNGTGFPGRLEGTDIPELARLVAIPHEYLILVHGYATTPPMPERDARDVIREDAGVILDPAMVEVYLDSLPPLGQEDYSHSK